MENISRDDIKGAINVIVAVGEAIRELREIPSGHLYAQLMDKLTLAQYDAIINCLVRNGVVERKNHLLTWIEPKAN